MKPVQQKFQYNPKKILKALKLGLMDSQFYHMKFKFFAWKQILRKDLEVSRS